MMTNPTNRNTILWADDDADDLQMMQEVLQESKEDVRIIEAANGAEVISILYSDGEPLPCLVVLDINMPVLNGKETLALLKKDTRFSSIPVVMFSTSSSEKDLAFCRQFGVEIFVKPCSYTGLKQVISKLLNYCGPAFN